MCIDPYVYTRGVMLAGLVTSSQRGPKNVLRSLWKLVGTCVLAFTLTSFIFASKYCNLTELQPFVHHCSGGGTDHALPPALQTAILKCSPPKKISRYGRPSTTCCVNALIFESILTCQMLFVFFGCSHPANIGCSVCIIDRGA